jgi:hypothetical protein
MLKRYPLVIKHGNWTSPINKGLQWENHLRDSKGFSIATIDYQRISHLQMMHQINELQ